MVVTCCRGGEPLHFLHLAVSEICIHHLDNFTNEANATKTLHQSSCKAHCHRIFSRHSMSQGQNQTSIHHRVAIIGRSCPRLVGVLEPAGYGKKPDSCCKPPFPTKLLRAADFFTLQVKRTYLLVMTSSSQPSSCSIAPCCNESSKGLTGRRSQGHEKSLSLQTIC